jgi:hypothetical protein
MPQSMPGIARLQQQPLLTDEEAIRQLTFNTDAFAKSICHVRVFLSGIHNFN